MKKLKLDIDKFEILSQDAEGKLVSGFSEAFEGEALDQMGTEIQAIAPIRTAKVLIV